MEKIWKDLEETLVRLRESGGEVFKKKNKKVEKIIW